MAPSRNPSGETRGRALPDLSSDAPDESRRDSENEAESGTEPSSPADLPRASLMSAVKRARVEFKRDNLTDLAASLTYYGLLSLVPALVVLISALGLLGRDATSEVISQVEAIAPGSSADFVRTLILQAQSNKTGAGLG